MPNFMLHHMSKENCAEPRIERQIISLGCKDFAVATAAFLIQIRDTEGGGSQIAGSEQNTKLKMRRVGNFCAVLCHARRFVRIAAVYPLKLQPSGRKNSSRGAFRVHHHSRR